MNIQAFNNCKRLLLQREMSCHAVEELNEVQSSNLFRDTLVTAIITVCRQIFAFSNFVRIDGKISFIVDDLQVNIILSYFVCPSKHIVSFCNISLSVAHS